MGRLLVAHAQAGIGKGELLAAMVGDMAFEKDVVFTAQRIVAYADALLEGL